MFAENGKTDRAGTMTDNTSVMLEKRGNAQWITINRPEKRNAINGEVVAGIAKGYRDAHDDPEVRVIVLTGAGRGFCAGADMDVLQGIGDRGGQGEPSASFTAVSQSRAMAAEHRWGPRAEAMPCAGAGHGDAPAGSRDQTAWVGSHPLPR